mmetsp:Transcript_112033/g.327637  ORF Transcript_112033/g.327637 Transcript_112033/m.327637 type:complete len:116 (+) Transcript_112033:1083-1430(+)
MAAPASPPISAGARQYSTARPASSRARLMASFLLQPPAGGPPAAALREQQPGCEAAAAAAAASGVRCNGACFDPSALADLDAPADAAGLGLDGGVPERPEALDETVAPVGGEAAR